MMYTLTDSHYESFENLIGYIKGEMEKNNQGLATLFSIGNRTYDVYEKHGVYLLIDSYNGAKESILRMISENESVLEDIIRDGKKDSVEYKIITENLIRAKNTYRKYLQDHIENIRHLINVEPESTIKINGRVITSDMHYFDAETLDEIRQDLDAISTQVVIDEILN